jgi:hypothetical protein
MKLYELVMHLKSVDDAKDYAKKNLGEVEYTSIEIYMVSPMSIDSEVQLFDATDLPPYNEVNIEGIDYINLLTINYLQEIVGDYVNDMGNKFDEKKVAERILNYVINDA